MPKNISTALLNHLKGEVHTLAVCWQIKRRDNQILGFTNHDQDILIDNVLYRAQTGILPSAFSSDYKLSVNNLELQGFLTGTGITEAAIRSGLYDGAEVAVFIVNYLDLPPDLNSNNLIWITKGYLGEIKNEGGEFFTAEIRGITQILQQQIGDVISPVCRYNLGDSRCKVNMAIYTHSGSVTGIVIPFYEFEFGSLSPPAGSPPYFASGSITFTTGQNAGFSFDLLTHSLTNRVRLLFPAPMPISVGDQFTIRAGCAKTLAACQSFNNVINFGGEPHLPGNDAMMSGNI